MLFYTKTVTQTLKELEVSVRGLSVIEATERLDRYGPNSVKMNGESFWRKMIEPFANVFMGVLFIAAIVSLLQNAFVDAAIILVIMTTSAIIFYVQRFSTERILRSLQKHTALKVETLRDNNYVEIDSSLLVPGDVISMHEGDKIPADVRIITASSLRVDESQLTGESIPVVKQLEALAEGKEVYEQSNILFQGSFIIGGETTAVVIATGNDTEFGQLAVLTADASDSSPVQVKIDKLVSHIIIAVMGIATVAFGLALYRGMNIIDSIRFVIALSVSAVPESLPIAISVVLVLGMRRMAAKKALVRTMRSIETIGIVTTIATDKTGTLTKNKLSVFKTWQFDGLLSTLKNSIERSINSPKGKISDPLDVALSAYTHSIHRNVPLIAFPFDLTVAMSGNLWHNGEHFDLYVKGAPESLLDRCTMSGNEHKQALAQLHEMTSSGFRVIAFGHILKTRKIESLSEIRKTDTLLFDGFVAVADELRPEAKGAIKKALAAGVTVRMITGDHFETAYHIGQELGMVTSRDQVFDSRRMRDMSDEDLEIIIRDVRVFSRVVPEYKHRILALLKIDNITAMTGDGVNDVPALTNAHVGIAMGSGASIAKDAGDIILIDNNFKSIVEAIHEGRTIYANIKRMLLYLLSTNTGEVLVALGALAIGMPIPLIPVQILWVNLVTDTSMVVPLGLEPGERRNMNKGPQRPDAPILSKFMISRIILTATTMAGLTLAVYIYYTNHYDVNYGRTAAFCALVVMQWASAFSTRSDYEPLWTRIRRWNGAFYIGLTIAVALQILAIFSPLGTFLHVTPILIGDVVIVSFIAFVVPIVMIETHKIIGRLLFNKGSKPLR
jgi:Ca2+-transporting ATPase